MRHWLWIPAAFVGGCFSEPSAPEASGGTDPAGSTGPQTTSPVDPSMGDESTTGLASTDVTSDVGSSSGTIGSFDSSSTGEPEPLCGNGRVEGDEQCDGDDPQGAACLDDCTITCLDQFQDCDEIPSGGCEIDTATDPNNCGTCGHICASAVCEDSACTPVAIAQGIGPGPTQITRIDDTFVFDGSGFGNIQRWDLGSGVAQELVSDDLTGVFRRFAIADGSVHWLDSNLGAAQRVPLDGGAVDFMFAVDGAGSPFASATHLYYPLTQLGGGLPVSNLLFATHAEAANTMPLVSDVPGQMCKVVEAAGRIVWTSADSDIGMGSVPPLGGAQLSHDVLINSPCSRPLFGVGTSVYFHGQLTAAGPFGLVRHNIANGTSAMVIQEMGFADLGDFFVSADGILADVSGEVRIYNLNGNQQAVIADASPNSAGRYLDDQVVLWTELKDSNWILWLGERP